MIDENAFGLFVSYFSLEDDEYALVTNEFLERVEAFKKCVGSYIAEETLGDNVRATDLGHAVYLEVAEDECHADAIKWLIGLRRKLGKAELECVTILTHGGRWVTDDEMPLHGLMGEVGSVKMCTVSGPSEPLRRALYADTATRPDAHGDGGWGPGLYIDTEAVEALNRTLKNDPTPLEVAGATFYRAGGGVG